MVSPRLGWTPVAVFPYAVGLAFFIPLDLSFSCWFFYLFWKIELIIASAIGLRSLPEFPYVEQQTSGAYIGLCIIAIWATREHLGGVIKTVVFGRSRGIDDSDEAMRYRTTIIIMLIAMALLTFFCLRLGMSVPVILVFLITFYHFKL